MCVCVCVCVHACVRACLCVFFASDSTETVEIIIVKLGTVTASNMRLHHVLIVLTLTFIQGHTDLNHENNKCLTISETIQVTPIKFAVKVFRLKVYMTSVCPCESDVKQDQQQQQRVCPMTLTFSQGHNCVSNFTSV